MRLHFYMLLNRQSSQSAVVQPLDADDSETTITWTSDRRHLAAFFRSDLTSLSADDVLKMISTFNGFSLSFVDLKDKSARVRVKYVLILILAAYSLFY